MKKQVITLLKIAVSLCLLIIISLNSNAQVGKKLIKHKSADSMTGKVKPVITSPAAGATIDGPFVMVGKAEPNTFINMYVTPSYTLPKSPDGKPVLVVSTPKHKSQHFTAKADANGVWQSPLIDVRFDSKTTERRIVVFVNQIWGTYTYTSKHIDYWASPKLTMLMETVKMPAKSQH